MTIDNQNATRFGGDFTDLWITVDETKLHFVKTGEGPPIILIPGWPQTWYAWRRVMPLLAKSGRRVIVAHAAQHPEMIHRLVLLEAGLPGITPDSAFALANAPRVFQFYLNSVPELPELLTRGKEREFLGWLFRTKTVNPDAISPADLDEYLRTYSDPARMTAGFEYYRAVLTDIEQNKSGYLNMPVLALGAEKGVGTTLYDALRKHVDDLEGGLIPGHGHYLPEECPEELTRRLLAFLRGRAKRSEEID
jgi:pimeloyl-ACP methyl ester carboxylesterase